MNTPINLEAFATLVRECIHLTGSRWGSNGLQAEPSSLTETNEGNEGTDPKVSIRWPILEGSLNNFQAEGTEQESSVQALRSLRYLLCSSASTRLQAAWEPAFDRLAVSLFRLQYESNPAYRRLCDSRNPTPHHVIHWHQIPAVPTSAFKQLKLSCLAPAEQTKVFHSSGTTEQEPSRHYHNAVSLALYEASLLPWFTRNVLTELDMPNGAGAPPSVLVALVPPLAEVPSSSLAHMFATVACSRQWSAAAFVGEVDASGAWRLNTQAAMECLQDAMDLNRAVVILGTAFSFVHLLDHLADSGLRFELPPGSRVMETGGYKGRSRELSRLELHGLIGERLGVSDENIVCEYGMCELSSQAYARVEPEYSSSRSPAASARHFHFPPWARAQVISPETGQEVAEGETGLIRVFDLANVYSVLAIQTEDLGVRRGNGFELLGRATAAEPRGCSLAAVSV